MKKIYFVRHGESEGNAGLIQQDRSSPLTKKGKEQVTSVAQRFIKLPIEIVLSSSMIRAKETAEIISGTTNVSIEFSDLFAERRKPSIMYGKRKDNPASVEAYKDVVINFHLPGFRHSDEENFDDLKKRALSALAYLSNRPEEHIVVVTHAYFLRILIACVLFGDTLTGEECSRCTQIFYAENTGVTIISYDAEKENPWRIWVWNDHAHLD